MPLFVRGGCKSATLEATITRADGTVEHLGVIGYTHRNSVVNFLGNAYLFFKAAKRRIFG